MKFFKILILAFFLIGLTACETIHGWISGDDHTYYPSAEPINTTIPNTKKQKTYQSSPNPNAQPSGPKEYYQLPAIVPGSTSSAKTTTDSDKTLQ